MQARICSSSQSIGAHPRRGSALLASLFVVVMIAGLGAYIVELQASFSRRQGSALDRKRALYIAEAGLAEAVLAISQGKSGALADEDVPARFHDGIYWVESEPLGDGRQMLTSRGRVGTGAFTVRLVVEPNVHPIGAAGFFGEEGLTVGDAVIIDGYDSRLGSFDAQTVAGFGFPTPGEAGLVQSNGRIVLDDAATWPASTPHPYLTLYKGLHAATQLKLSLLDPTSVLRLALATAEVLPNESYVLGTLRPGCKETVETNGNTKILLLDPAQQDVELPEIVAPLTHRSVGAGTVVINSVVTHADLSASGGKLRVTKFGELRLVGPVVLDVGRVDVMPGGTVVLDDSAGPIQIHVRESLSFQPGSVLVSNGADAHGAGTYIFVAPDPSDDSRVQFEPVGVFRGVVHAPGDRVTLPTGLRYFGAASAKHLTIADGAWITYDAALRVGGIGVPALPRQQTWSIVEEPQPAVRVGFDPIADLVRRGITPRTWIDAAPESEVIAEYIDGAGFRQSFAGVLDAGQVGAMERVISLRWRDPVADTYREPIRPSGMDVDDLIARHRENRRAARGGP